MGAISFTIHTRDNDVFDISADDWDFRGNLLFFYEFGDSRGIVVREVRRGIWPWRKTERIAETCQKYYNHMVRLDDVLRISIKSAQAIEAGTATTGTGVVHESAVAESDTPTTAAADPSTSPTSAGVRATGEKL